MKDNFLVILAELFKSDPELHDSLVDYIKSCTEAQKELAEMRKRRYASLSKKGKEK